MKKLITLAALIWVALVAAVGGTILLILLVNVEVVRVIIGGAVVLIITLAALDWLARSK